MSEFDFDTAPALGGEARGDGLPMRSPLSDPAVRPAEEDFDRSLRPRTLDDFVGQQRVREQLQVFIGAARHRGEALDHALFAGPPGLGKCVDPDTMLFTTHGMVPIGTLGDLHGDSWQPITRPVAGLYGNRTADYFYNNGVGDTLTITTGSGYRLKGTPNHPVLVRSATRRLEFKRLSELRTGDEVAIRIGAQVFGSSTRLHVEGVKGPTLADPAVVPAELTPDLARLLGLLLVGGRLSPGGDGVVVTVAAPEREAELGRLFEQVFCLHVDEFGEGPLGRRFGQRSPRVATLLAGLGLTREGFTAIPADVLRAPRMLVAEFLRGLFWGVEHAPVVTARERSLVAQVQLVLLNFGICSRIVPVEGGFQLHAEVEPARYDEVEPAGIDSDPARHAEPGMAAPAPMVGFGTVAASYVPPSADHMGQIDYRDLQREADNTPHARRPAMPGPQARGAAAVVAQYASRPAAVEAPAGPDSPAVPGTGDGEVGFGLTPAGVLVALAPGHDLREGYRRGSAITDDILRVRVRSGPKVIVEPGTSVTVDEVEPVERPRVLTREGALRHDLRALAVRSVRSTLRPNEIVELVYDPITSLEPGHGHTCDVSVPDGHTFIGNGIVCHNTTLASVVANELGSNLHITSGPALEKKADVAAILTSLGPRDVLFIDEIHRLNTAIEEVLYSAMEDYQIDIVLGQGPAARTLRLDLEQFTLVGATTRTGLLTTPLRDRFGLIQRLEHYNVDELRAIVLRSAGLLDIAIDHESASEIASRSRGTPRIANRLLRRVRDVAQVRHQGAITIEVAREALDLVDIDAVGLDRTDRRILEAILVKFSGGPVGLGTLAVAIGEEPHTIEDVYEPFLLQKGFIQRTPRGRVITPAGRRHLGELGIHSSEPPAAEQPLFPS